MTNTTRLAGLVACMLLAGTANAAFAYSGQELAPDAKLTIDQARAIALKAAPARSQNRNWRRKAAAADCVTHSSSSAAPRRTKSESMPRPAQF